MSSGLQKICGTKIAKGVRTLLDLLFAMAKKKSSPLPDDVLRYFVAQGKKGGKKSVEIRQKKYTPQERSELAKKAAQARWSKQREAEQR